MIVLPDGQMITDATEAEIAGSVHAPFAPPVSVIVVSNGAQKGAVETGKKFRIAVPLEVGENRITVNATDAAGTTAQVDLYIIRLVTDRTTADVNAIRELSKIGLKGWTAEQHAEYLLAAARGSYNRTDINRVVAAMRYLDERLDEMGYQSGYIDQRNDWTKEEYFREPDIRKYLGSAQAAKDRFKHLLVLPDVPPDMQDMTVTDANDIERILVVIDSLIPYIKKSYWYTNEIFCGEV